MSEMTMGEISLHNALGDMTMVKENCSKYRESSHHE